MTTIAILGAGGHASDVLSVVEASEPTWSVVLGDDGEVDERRFAQRSVRFATIEDSLRQADVFVSGVGYPATRRSLVERAVVSGGAPSAALVDPRAALHPTSRLAPGTVVSGFVWLSPQVGVEEHCWIGYGSKIGHDTTVGSHSSLMPGAFVGGDCRVGSGVLIGANATVLQGLTIGDGAVIGAGSVVTRDVSEGSVVTGVPGASR